MCNLDMLSSLLSRKGVGGKLLLIKSVAAQLKYHRSADC